MKQATYVPVLLSALFYSSFSLADDQSLKAITENITRVCEAPDTAGKYWDTKVRSNGEASINLKLEKMELNGIIVFSRGEWEGIRSTVEENNNYKVCVEKLVPIFMEKLSPELIKINENSRVIGGVKHVEFSHGAEMTLDKCVKITSKVICSFNLISNGGDMQFSISGGSSIYDQQGRKFNVSLASIANFKAKLSRTKSVLIGEVVENINTKVILEYPHVSEDTNSLSKILLETSIRGKEGSGYNEFIFRNVEISIEPISEDR